MTIVIISLIVLVVLGLAAFFKGIVNAEEVDPKEPFLWDDYEEIKEE